MIVLTGRKLGFNDRSRKGGRKIYFRQTTIFPLNFTQLLLTNKMRNLDKTDTDGHLNRKAKQPRQQRQRECQNNNNNNKL